VTTSKPFQRDGATTSLPRLKRVWSRFCLQKRQDPARATSSPAFNANKGPVSSKNRPDVETCRSSRKSHPVPTRGSSPASECPSPDEPSAILELISAGSPAYGPWYDERLRPPTKAAQAEGKQRTARSSSATPVFTARRSPTSTRRSRAGGRVTSPQCPPLNQDAFQRAGREGEAGVRQDDAVQRPATRARAPSQVNGSAHRYILKPRTA